LDFAAYEGVVNPLVAYACLRTYTPPKGRKAVLAVRHRLKQGRRRNPSLAFGSRPFSLSGPMKTSRLLSQNGDPMERHCASEAVDLKREWNPGPDRPKKAPRANGVVDRQRLDFQESGGRLVRGFGVGTTMTVQVSNFLALITFNKSNRPKRRCMCVTPEST
jgi:hypothetical protein